MAQKCLNCNSEPAQRGPEPELPVANAEGSHSKPAGDLVLGEAQVQPVLPQLVAEGAELARIPRIRWSLSSEVDMAERQRNPAPVASMGTGPTGAPAIPRPWRATGDGSRGGSWTGSICTWKCRRFRSRSCPGSRQGRGAGRCGPRGFSARELGLIRDIIKTNVRKLNDAWDKHCGPA